MTPVTPTRPAPPDRGHRLRSLHGVVRDPFTRRLLINSDQAIRDLFSADVLAKCPVHAETTAHIPDGALLRVHNANPLLADGAHHERLRSLFGLMYKLGGRHTSAAAASADAVAQHCRQHPRANVADLARWGALASLSHMLGIKPVETESLMAHARGLSLLTESGGERFSPELEEQAQHALAAAENILRFADRHDPDGWLRGLRRHEDVDLPAILVIIAMTGFDTTEAFLSSTITLTAASDAIQAGLRDGASPAAVVRELGRLEAPVQYFGYGAIKDGEIGGRPFHTNDLLSLGFGAACLDPNRFDDPHVFNPDRTATPSLLFGIGSHKCPGAKLAITVAATTLSHLTNRFTLSVDGEVGWSDRIAIRSVAEATIVATPRAPSP